MGPFIWTLNCYIDIESSSSCLSIKMTQTVFRHSAIRNSWIFQLLSWQAMAICSGNTRYSILQTHFVRKVNGCEL